VDKEEVYIIIRWHTTIICHANSIDYTTPRLWEALCYSCEHTIYPLSVEL